MSLSKPGSKLTPIRPQYARAPTTVRAIAHQWSREVGLTLGQSNVNQVSLATHGCQRSLTHSS